ncbi:hypothetical protein ACLOJK_024835 [Asimina triloba]
MVGITTENGCDNEIPHNAAEIVVVRHGETTWNASGRIQIAERLAKEKKPTAIYSSDLKRAKNTAEMIAKKCHIRTVTEVPQLKERHVGSLQGLFWGEIQEKEPEAYHAFFSSEHDLEIPGGGESFNQLCERSVEALEEIASRHKGERVIVVTHGGILRAIYMSVTREPSAGKVLNASINVLHLSDKNWAFKSWSDVAHLDEVGFLQRGFDAAASVASMATLCHNQKCGF